MISYSHVDRARVDEIVGHLRSHAVEVWIDHEQVRVGDSIPVALGRAIESSDFLVVILSRASLASPWVREELNAAFMRQVQAKGTKVLPVVIESLTSEDLPPFLRDKRYANCSTGLEAGLADLVAALTHQAAHKGTSGASTTAPTPAAAPPPPSPLERLAEEQRLRAKRSAEAHEAKVLRDERVLNGADDALAALIEHASDLADHAKATLPRGPSWIRIEKNERDILIHYGPAVLSLRFYQFYTNVPDGKLIATYSVRRGEWYHEQWSEHERLLYPLEYDRELGLCWDVAGRRLSGRQLAERAIVALIELGDRRRPDE